jgi:hypothetical protein
MGVTAVAVVVTTLAPTAAGCIVDYSATSPNPGICNTSFQPTENVTVTDIVAVGTNGDLSVANQSTGTVGVAVSVIGYFSDATLQQPGETYVGLPETLLADTRSGVGAPEGQIPAGGTITVQVSGQDGIPDDAGGVAMFLGAANASVESHRVVYGG